jgi:hypothetical protein
MNVSEISLGASPAGRCSDRWYVVERGIPRIDAMVKMYVAKPPASPFLARLLYLPPEQVSPGTLPFIPLSALLHGRPRASPECSRRGLALAGDRAAENL